MEKISTVSRIHPLVAGAAISVTVLALVGTAAIAGWLPTSKGAIGPNGAATSEFAPVEVAGKGQVPPQGAALAQQSATAEPAHTQAPAPVHHKAPRPHHSTQVAQASPADYERPRQQAPQAAPQPQQPNYVGIGAGAVIGGLLGNQVGSGRGRTLATVAGAIGGGMLGNEVQKRQQEPQQPER